MKGVNEMITLIKRIGEKFPDRVASAIYVEAEIVMTEAKRRTPVAKNGGTLRASGQVHDPERHGRSISVLMSFGGAADAYAIAVHEHLSEHSPPSWIAAEEGGMGVTWRVAGTGPKYLEGPINEAMPTMASKLAARLHLDKP